MTHPRKVYWLSTPAGNNITAASLRGDFTLLTDDQFYAQLAELAGDEVVANEHEGDAFMQAFSLRRKLTAVMRQLLTRWPETEGIPRDLMVLTTTQPRENPKVPNNLFVTADAACHLYDTGHAKIKGDKKGIFYRVTARIPANYITRY